MILDSVSSLHGATELTGTHDVTTPIIDQITAQQIAGSAMFGTVENMQRGGPERRPAKSNLSQVNCKYKYVRMNWYLKSCQVQFKFFRTTQETYWQLSCGLWRTWTILCLRTGKLIFLVLVNLGHIIQVGRVKHRKATFSLRSAQDHPHNLPV